MSQDIFKRYPSVEVFYATTDKQCFFSENDAHNHAKTLEDKEVTPLHRPEEKDSKPKNKPKKQDDEASN